MMRQSKFSRLALALPAGILLAGGAWAERVVLEAASGPTPGGEIEIISGEFAPSINKSTANFLTPDTGSIRLEDAGADSEVEVLLRPQLPFAGSVRVSLAYPETANASGLILSLENADPPQTFPVTMTPNEPEEWHVVGIYFPEADEQPVFRLESTGEMEVESPAYPLAVYLDGIRFDSATDAPPRPADDSPFAVELDEEAPFVPAEDTGPIEVADDPFAVEYDEAESPFAEPDADEDLAVADDPFAVEYDETESPFAPADEPDDVAEDPLTVEYDDTASPFEPADETEPETITVDVSPAEETYTPGESVPLPEIDTTEVLRGEYNLREQGLPRVREIAPPTNALASSLVTARSPVFASSGIPGSNRPGRIFEPGALEIRDPAVERVEGSINWLPSLEEARAEAREHRRPVVIVFLGRNRASDEVAANQLKNRGVADVMNQMIPVMIDIDQHGDVARRHAVREAPYAVVLSPEGFTRGHVQLNRHARNIIQDLQVLMN